MAELTVDGVRLRTASGDDAGTTLRLSPGTVTLLLGANGAGKSAWLEKLAGLRDPEGLAIAYGAEPLWQSRSWRRNRLNPAALRQYGYACQSPEDALFQRSLAAELAFSQRPYAQAERASAVQAALTAVGWDDDWLARDPFHMSGGERRRVALAALFVTPAPWLLLDEPTAGLDRDGHVRLADRLLALKGEGRGILLVSHDLEWALALADRVLLLQPDRALLDCAPEELAARPELLAQAGMRVPPFLRIVHRIRGAADRSRLWTPAGAAEALAGERRGGGTAADAQPHEEPADAPTAARHPAQTEDPHRLARFDPRAVWLGCLLVTAAIFSLSTWPGLLAGFAAAAAVIFLAHIPMRRWSGLLAGYAAFTMLAAALAGTAAGTSASAGLGFDADVFAGTLFPFARTIAAMLIGFSLPLVLTPLSLRRSLEQLAAPRGGPAPAALQRPLLAAALTVRFVPVLFAEWERYGRIHLARGKVTAKTPLSLLRRLRNIAFPFLLALFRLGDEAAAALESRGVRRHVRPTPGETLRWRARDTAMLAVSAASAAMLWLLP